MEQRVIWAGGADFPICTERVNEITKEMNAKGFELTFVTTQSKDDNPAAYTDAMLVFTKK